MPSDSSSKPPASNVKSETQIRTYKRAESAVFSKTKEGFGGLSNMAAGFPISVNGVRILTSEALYQACRFPHLPQVQRMIIQQSSPMTAKMKSKPYRKDSRPDWDRVRVKIMRWCLRVKLSHNWSEFSRLLLATGDRAIVEESRKDDFWGAKVVDANTLTGMNVLGRLLMELREEIKQRTSEQFGRVEPLPLADFLLFGEPIATVEAQQVSRGRATVASANGGDGATRVEYQSRLSPVATRIEDQSLFDGTSPGSVNARGGALIDALQPYPEYKESTLPWLEAIPLHWDEGRAKYFFREVDDRSETGKEELLSVSHLTGVTPRREKTVTMFLAKSNVGHKVVRPDDVVINTMWAWMAALGVARYAGLVSPSYGVYRPLAENRLKPRYVDHLLRIPSYAAEYLCRSTGVNSSRLRLYPEQFLSICLICPPANEQATIVKFLDYVNRRIGRFVRARKKVIELLNEQKQAIIQRSVSRGLDPNVQLKPSGIVWLGEIPQHWGLRRLKYLSRINTGGRDTINRVDNGMYPFFVRSQTVERINTYAFDGEAVLTAGDGAGVAKVFHYVNGKFDYHQRVYKFSNFRDLLGQFFFYYLQSNLRFEAFKETAKSTVDSLRLPMLHNFPVALPPIEEQGAIVASVKAQCELPDHAIRRTEQEIGLIREYQKRLIADVVTGRLDVRDVARDLPVDTEDPAIPVEEEDPTEEAEMIEDEQMA